MTSETRCLTAGAIAVVLTLALAPIGGAQQRGGRGMHMDDAQRADMPLFHALFEHRHEITRTVTLRPDGVEAVTESSNPAVARQLWAHVDSMLARVKEARPIHQRDPLFREIFRHASQIHAQAERTATGVRVIETSSDPYVVKLIHAHADVVSRFIANGHVEMMTDHAVPQG